MGRLPALVVVVCACGVALAGQGAPRQVSLLITGGTVVTVDAARRVIANGARGHRRHRHRWRRYRRGDRQAVPRRRHHRRDRPAGAARADQHPHARADGPLSRAGGRPRADGLAEQLHLPGRSQDRLSRVRAGRHAPGGARDDRVGHHDLRGHVLLRGGGGPRDQGGGPPRCAGSDRHPVPGRRREDAGRSARPRRSVHPQVQGRSADHAGGGAARDVHAGRPDVEGGAGAVAAVRRADPDPPGGDARRDPDCAGTLCAIAHGLSRESRVLGAGSAWRHTPCGCPRRK